MPEKGWEDLPEHDVGDAPNRFDVDGFRARLFGGPGATLYGDSGIPAQSAWDSKEIPTVGPNEDSGYQSGYHTGPQSGFHSGVFNSGADLLGDSGRDSGSLVRPYTKTGGRTRSNYDLAIEALVSTSERGKAPDAAVLPEHRSICGLCLDTRSVAEVAAHLRLPLGVAKVLIGDMAGMGLVLIHQSGMVVGDRPSIEFMERVLSGLRRL
ncbi:DUF742 domain-containing protein [Actinophytocola gossypii]|uniref:DUF742 domain-containing protein n=1 Tax=Actinophytocola gossypii TaxID=2812003 RepID=A0ABT2J4B1_9PSEU|nr:DUF742 domain-containing protein [Actinophytocola gossypii]MCT2582696.1 DUF742 domain-containing protein [Actinophytocola gossypii]